VCEKFISGTYLGEITRNILFATYSAGTLLAERRQSLLTPDGAELGRVYQLTAPLPSQSSD